MNYYLGLLLVAMTWPLYAQQTVFINYPDSFKIVCDTSKGLLHGNYVSYYNNGQRRAQGKFKHNRRIGKWSVWDKSGQLVARRSYTAPFVYQTLYPKAPSTPLIALLNVPQYRPERHADGYMAYYYVHERTVFWESQVWRFLPNKGLNATWMPKLYQLLQRQRTQQTVTTYEDAYFEKEAQTSAKITSTAVLLGFQLREVDFFDTERFLKETRILGFRPIFAERNTNDTIKGHWYHYPKLRALLAQQAVDLGLDNNCQNLDDLLFYRCFNSFVYQQGRSHGQKPALPRLEKIILAPASNRYEMHHIEQEHDFWKIFARKN
jgi:hypothetical protein